MITEVRRTMLTDPCWKWKTQNWRIWWSED